MADFRDLDIKRILVTGGTGFLGGRLVERLMLEGKAVVRALVRSNHKAVKLARFSPARLELINGDLRCEDDIKRAMAGCDIVFNCATGTLTNPADVHGVNVTSLQQMLAAAAANNVERFVHVSSSAVYDVPHEGVIDESCPRRMRKNNAYINTKIEGENLVMGYYRNGLPGVVVQPTAIYGPDSPLWTVQMLERMKRGNLILVNGGSGIRNLVFVDDAVTALLLSATRREAIGEVFLITDGDPVTWRRYCSRMEETLGQTATVSMSAEEATAFYHSNKARKSLVSELIKLGFSTKEGRQRLGTTREAALLRQTASLLVPSRIRREIKKIIKNEAGAAAAPAFSKPVFPLDPVAIKLYSSKAVFSIEKAKHLLGYEPRFDFETGMAATEAWSRWANLLDSPASTIQP